jgi:hypothetical protein
MPLIPPVMQSSMLLKAASTLISGSKLSSFVSAVSSATSQYILTSAIVNSTNTVLGPGVGTQTGTVVGLIPNQMSSMMRLKAASTGLAGKDIIKLFDAVSFGVVTSMSTVLMQGTVIGGGPGTGTGKIIGLVPSALTGLILAQEAVRLLGGSKISSLVSAISFGICTHIMSAGTVNIINIGVAAPPPVGPILIPTAPGIGRLV